MTTSKRIFAPVSYAFAVFCSAMFLYPLLFTFQASLKDNTEIYNDKPFALPLHWIWSNYTDAMRDGGIGRAVLNSALYAACGTALALLLGVMAAFALSRFRFRLQNALYLYFTTGLMIPVFSLMIPISRMIATVDGFNKHWSLILLYGVFELPFTIFLIAGYMKGISRELDESAAVDGCPPAVLLFRILLPLAMPAVSTAGILAFFDIYNDLIWNVLLVSKDSMFNISVSLMSFIGEHGTARMGPMFAGIMITILPTIAVYLMFQERVESGLSAGAVKE